MSTFLHCDAPVRGDNDKIRKSNNQSQLQFHGGLMFSVPLQEQFTESANKSYHVCRVIVVLQSFYNCFGIR